MSYYFKNIKPGVESESDEGEDLERLLKRSNQDDVDESSDDELRTLSFGSLKKADTMMEEEEGSGSKSNRKLKDKPSRPPKPKSKPEFVPEQESQSEPESDSGSSDSEFFEEESSKKDGDKKKKKKKNKHAPAEQSAKKPVSRVREIPGLHISKNQNPKLYQDIRFDKSTGGPTDSSIIRRRYGFLDEYRQREIEEMESMLKDRKLISKLPPEEVESIGKRLQSTKSRLQTMKSRDLEHNIVKEYEESLNKDNKNKFHLKRSERRKLVQKWKFEHMKSKQREKVMERKRKKRLGKEFKQFEFNK
ncbi:hypothetical protein ZYGR_0AF01590 [Zygosaccharomyces rouxii]|uniref:rRNA biogenesis protein RRP36 n=1 Tax=Zygosaccharomyces rouxii TaxID=4956 RepID=A0A1Q3A7P2_ZYGRO|nr:hypothetical protein ZYGR_0AF01590 [Zygosaccharomyces rouxii]